MNWDKEIMGFIQQLAPPANLPDGVEVLQPFDDKEVISICNQFYQKFYNDKGERFLMIGINPGRFGGGITGIPFTDPIRLQIECGIDNNWQKKQELSSLFMYEMMKAFGSVEKFYNQFYISAISPLGFVQNGKNLNYYDIKTLKEAVTPFVIDCMEKQLQFNINRSVCFCIGEGENLKYLQQLNANHKWFERIEPLAHPRFIMQYKLKKKQEYIERYLQAFAKYEV